jgi:DNA polymerase
MILTPKGSACFDNGKLSISVLPANKPEMADPTEALWLTYYASIFNPARLKVKAMQAEMPKKYWRNLPETAIIPALIAEAPARVTAMTSETFREAPAFHARLVARRENPIADHSRALSSDTLLSLREAARKCTRCSLHCHATQVVFGEGPESPELMIVGEQPGDQEDLTGRPFVGPAGKLFNQILGRAGIDRSTTYVTNAVKHFKHEPRGKRRLHRTPNAGEVERCRWWLDREIDVVKPRLIVAMGATALLALSGERGKLADLRGRVLPFDRCDGLIVTVHPSYLLRLSDPAIRDEEERKFSADLVMARRWLEKAQQPKS